MKARLSRRPSFWVVFSVLAIAGAVTAQRLFTVALPNVALEITMDRQEAISAAADLAAVRGWEPAPARSAASFGQVDSEVQTYVELEGGGRDAFVSLADDGVYQPYQWTVRRFAEGQIAEHYVWFTPSGERYGFLYVLAEDDPAGGNLESPVALEEARRAASEWVEDFAVYDLLESGEETLPAGRIDHSFVFERRDRSVASARFRLRVRVSGEVVTEVRRYVHVPEAFARRYAEMRAANDAIALASSAVFILVFVLLGAGVGTVLLLRAGWVEWRTALVWGLVVAGLVGLNTVNALPLAWMSYDTAVSAGRFVFQNVAAAGAITLLGGPLLAFFFLAGESLGRRAFPEHLQQWRFWSTDVARSNTALGLTAGAYLLVGLEVGYVVLFYLGTARLDGWWSPADALVQPDLLATYAPWLQAVSISLFASFWEESVFRAVPIACAALIGARFGRRNLWIWGMVVIQAIVFAAGHANYPQQPSYARVIELSVPALAWGGVYVFFGLVPTILTHFLYDLVLFSSVLFASEATFDQGVIIAVGLLPILILVRARLRAGATSRAPDWAFNRAWRPSATTTERPFESAVPDGPDQASDPGGISSDRAVPAVSASREAHEGPSGSVGLPGFVLPGRLTAILGVAGFLLWGSALLEEGPAPTFQLDRAGAVSVASEALAGRTDPEEWTPLVTTTSGLSASHDYVVETVGDEAYAALLGSYLDTPHWMVRFVRWDAPPEERVEEYRVRIGAGGEVTRLTHVLPEDAPGDVLDESTARQVAETVVRRTVATPGRASPVEVSAEAVVRTARTDWEFGFLDPSVLNTVEGEARIEVTLAGSEVADVRRYVDTPERWERERREEASGRGVVTGGLGLTLFLMLGVAAVVAVVRWSRVGLPLRVVAWVGGGFGFATLLATANQWPSVVAGFTTAQPQSVQIGGALFGLLFVGLIGGAASGLVAGLAHSWMPSSLPRARPAVGIALGLLYAGVGSAAGSVWGGIGVPANYGQAATFIPWVAAPLEAGSATLLLFSAFLVTAAATARHPGHPVVPSVVGFTVLSMGILIVPDGLREQLWLWGVAATVAAFAIYALVRFIARDPRTGIFALGTLVASSGVEAAWAGGFTGARTGGVLYALVAAGIAWVWSRGLESPEVVATSSVRSPLP